MKIWLLCLCLFCLLTGCGQDVPEETIPIDLQTMPPETDGPETVMEPAETEEPASALLLPAEADVPAAQIPEENAVIYTEPSFVPAELLLSDFGDMELDPEGYYYFVKDETIEIEYACGIRLDFPESWEVGGTTALDIPRREAGIYSTKRMEYYNYMYRQTEADVFFEEKSTPAGLAYRYWTTTGNSIEGLGVVWHHCEFPVEAGDTFYFHIYFLTFSDDPEDYFEMHIQPVIDSVKITLAQ